MIHIQDNFLPDTILRNIQKYLINFQEVDTGEKKFWVMDAPIEFTNYVVNKLSHLEGQTVTSIISFFRISSDKVDTDWRIHCDSIINGEIPNRAIVLYLSNSTLTTLNGTAFWQHKSYGDFLPIEELDTEVYNKLIREDAEDLDKWNLSSVIGFKNNRLISYPSNYFHSKYPNKSWEEGRKVFVMFYKYT